MAETFDAPQPKEPVLKRFARFADNQSGMTPSETTLLVVEDDAMVRDWLRAALEGSEFRIAGTAHSAVEALELIRRRRPSLLLVDQRLPDRVGTELVRELRHQGVQTPALLMTANQQEGFNEAAGEAGAQGSVLKTGRLDELLEPLRAVAQGGAAFDYRHPRRAPGLAALSPREREVLALVARGATNRQIASELRIGDETVKTLLNRTFAKLGVGRRAEAVAEAHNRGIL
jgi:DNA-binding NarL/FixJ family response regulator